MSQDYPQNPGAPPPPGQPGGPAATTPPPPGYGPPPAWGGQGYGYGYGYGPAPHGHPPHPGHGPHAYPPQGWPPPWAWAPPAPTPEPTRREERHDHHIDLLAGLAVGAAAAWLLSNDQVQRTVIRSAVTLWTTLQGGLEEMKERVRDAEAELRHAAGQPANGGAAPASPAGGPGPL